VRGPGPHRDLEPLLFWPVVQAPRQIAATVLMTLFQNRGWWQWIVLAAGGGFALILGSWLPTSGGSIGGLEACIVHVVSSLLLTTIALTLGARALAGDRAGGLSDLVMSKPLSGASFYIGRFGGLALRLGAAALLVALVGGSALAVLSPRGAFFQVTEPTAMTVAGRPYDAHAGLLLPPDGTAIRWIFRDLEGAMAAARSTADGVQPDRTESGPCLRFDLKLLHPRNSPLRDRLPVRIAIHGGSRELAVHDLELTKRREFRLPLPGSVGSTMEVELSIRDSVGFIETGVRGCRLIHGRVGPVTALIRAQMAFLPVLWFVLALALLFSAVVSEPSALLAATVVMLVIFAAPTLEREIELWRAALAHGEAGVSDTGGDVVRSLDDGGCCEPQPPSGWAGPQGVAAAIVGALVSCADLMISALPELSRGGGTESLAGCECLTAADLRRAWLEVLPRLIVVLLLGGMFTSWRRA